MPLERGHQALRRVVPLLAGRSPGGGDRGRSSDPIARRATSLMASSSPPARPSPPLLALFGPTASGKTAVAARPARPARRGGHLGRLGGALPRACRSSPRRPRYPARLVGTVPLTEDVSVGEYQRLRARGDRRGRARPLLVGGTGLYFRAAVSALELPPPAEPGRRAHWQAEYDRLGGAAAHEELTRVDPAAAARVHAERPQARRPRARARRDGRLARARARPAVDRGRATPRRDRRARSAARGARRPDRGADARDGRSRRRRGGAPRVGGRALATARKVLGLEQFATLPEHQAVAEVALATRRLARYQRKWLRRMPGRRYARLRIGLRRRSPMRSSRWQAQGNVYLVTDDGPLTPDSVRSEVGDADGILEVFRTGERLARDRDLEPGRLAGRDVGQRDADRGELAGRAHGCRRGRRPRRPARGPCPDARRRPRRAGSRRGLGRRARGGRRHPADDGRRREPARRRRGRSGDELPRIGPLLEVHERFPRRTNVQVARRTSTRHRGARLGARGGGDGIVRLERRRGRRGVRLRAGRRLVPGRRADRPLRRRRGAAHRAGNEGRHLSVTVVFETHSTSTDNEAGIATGWNDGALSETGREQAWLLGERRRDDGIDVVLCSDLARAVETAEIAFAGTAIPIRYDARLRECNYGSLNGMPRATLDAERRRAPRRAVAAGRVAGARLSRGWPVASPSCPTVYAGKRVLVIGHVATRWALDHRANGVALGELLVARTSPGRRAGSTS